MQGGLPRQLNIAGAICDLAHLEPFVYTYAGHGEDGADLRIRVTFTSHVFSITPPDDQPGHFIDRGGKPRRFCPDRYAVSLGLPDQIRAMLEANAWSWEMKDRNGYANLAVLTDPRLRLLDGIYNVVIYYLFPSRAPTFEVEMMVMTCYQRPLNFRNHSKRAKMRNLARECHFKKIRVPKN